MRPLGISPQLSLQASRLPLLILNRSLVARKRMRSRQQKAARARLYLALWRPEGRGPGDGAFQSHLLNPKRLIFSLLPPTPKPRASGTVFFSSSFLSPPFFIFKENSRLAEGAQLRRSLAAQRAQQGAAGLPNPFPGKAGRPMSKFSNY